MIPTNPLGELTGAEVIIAQPMPPMPAPAVGGLDPARQAVLERSFGPLT